jgi:aryl-alcohol dehydrogenase-like predicted oxidoreductase
LSVPTILPHTPEEYPIIYKIIIFGVVSTFQPSYLQAFQLSKQPFYAFFPKFVKKEFSMEYRILGKTGLKVSLIGFGAWGIGGPVMAGDVPIGWGNIDDTESEKAVRKAYELGVNFFDTADFYGLGHSEEILGEVLKNKDVVIATKVGHQLMEDGSIHLNYSKDYILKACEKSLKRLQRDSIDLYQLHSARMEHLENGECIAAMEQLKSEGKIKYWGISLNTFEPEPEAEFFIKNNMGSVFQVVLNVINQKALEKVIPSAGENNYGIIARMPLQFGLLTGKFSHDTHFEKNDHRVFRLTTPVLHNSLDKLLPVWEIQKRYNISKTSFALSFIASHPEVSTIIPGIKTERQAEENIRDIISLKKNDMDELHKMYRTDFEQLMRTYV